jgi:hypothetical protein
MRLIEGAAVIHRTATQLARSARRLLLIGEPQAAAVTARTAIETRLCDMASWTPEAHAVRCRRFKTGRRPTIADRAKALKRAGVLTRSQEKDLSRWADIGGRAAHNESITLAEAFDIVQGAAAFVGSFTDPDEERFPEYFTN